MRGNSLIREARRRAGVSQVELARRVGTTQSAIARLERGRGAPSLARLAEIAAACGFDLQVHLAKADVETWTQAKANAALPPGERIERMLRSIHLAERLRASGEADRRAG